MTITPLPSLCVSLVILGPLLLSVPVDAGPEADGLKKREFRFTYEATVKGLRKGQTARIWIPVPPSNQEQEITKLEQEFPAKGSIAREPKYGNEILYLEAKAGDDGIIHTEITYRVCRKAVKTDFHARVQDKEGADLFLTPDARVPVGGKPLTLLKGMELPHEQLQLARLLYDVVNNHMRYSKEGTGWGRGDAEWACDSGYGNCSDFHSLFISLARSQGIPAKLEMGFPIPEKRGKGEIASYHCWARLKPQGKGWVPVDISEANKNPAMKDYYFGNLTEDRVTFSVGRDLELVPKQDGPAVNFLIYPYVEVDGKPYDAAKIQKKFSYADLPAGK